MSATMTLGLRHTATRALFQFGRQTTQPAIAGLNERNSLQPSSATSKPQWLTVIERRLNDLASWEHDWDQRGSAKPSTDALSYAATLLGELMRPGIRLPSINALGSGAIQLSWAMPNLELDIEVTRPNEMIVYFCDEINDIEREWRPSGSLSDISHLVDLMQV